MKHCADKDIDAYAEKNPEFKAFLDRRLSLSKPEQIVLDAFDPLSPLSEDGAKLKTKKDCEAFAEDWIEDCHAPKVRPRLRKERKGLAEALWKEIKNRKRWSKMSFTELAEEIIQEDIEILRGLE